MRQPILTIGLLALLAVTSCSRQDAKPVKAKPVPAEDAEKHLLPEPQVPKPAPIAETAPVVLPPKSTELHTPAQSPLTASRTVRRISSREIRGTEKQSPPPIEDTRGMKLAKEILNLTVNERLEWVNREFERRGFDVYTAQ